MSKRDCSIKTPTTKEAKEEVLKTRNIQRVTCRTEENSTRLAQGTAEGSLLCVT